jgi:hypothetical protein
MAMSDQETPFTPPKHREPWNKGKFTGAKPPLRPKHVWAVRSKLQAEGRTRDLAMFNLTIDSKLRACDVVALKVEDVAPNGYAADRATVRQRKTGQPVRFELTEHTLVATSPGNAACTVAISISWQLTAPSASEPSPSASKLRHLLILRKNRRDYRSSSASDDSTVDESGAH